MFLFYIYVYILKRDFKLQSTIAIKTVTIAVTVYLIFEVTLRVVTSLHLVDDKIVFLPTKRQPEQQPKNQD